MGYGPVGYGAFRTARVLCENVDAPRILRDVALKTRRDGGAEAFGWLKQHRLRHLGVSFATKYLYFCSGAEASPALVLDRRVQRWLWRHADLHVSLNWNVDDYRRYLCLVTKWAGELDLRPDEVEYLMFWTTARAARRRGGTCGVSTKSPCWTLLTRLLPPSRHFRATLT
ncbi:hypothetical protein V2I01_38755 [Micromonospora sp. BRA006-A]|nr:hypothetical protein [Micromonospora sp. BRA006-A]